MFTVTYHCFAVGLYNGLHNPPYVCARSCSLYILLCIIDITCPRSAHVQISCAHNRACCFSSFLACSQLSNSEILNLSLPPSCFRVSVLVLPIRRRLAVFSIRFPSFASTLSSVPSDYVSSAARDYLSIIFSRWLVSRPDKRRHRPEWQLNLWTQDLMCMCNG